MTTIIESARFEVIPIDHTDAHAIPIVVELAYDTVDPYAVRITFLTTGDDTVAWLLARDLLAAAALGSGDGDGDVVIYPMLSRPDHLQLTLRSCSGFAHFAVPTDTVRVFLQRTNDAVPPGTETDHVDLDAELAALLTREPAPPADPA